MTELATLLKQHGLEQYHQKLLEEGYDIDTLKEFGISESDLNVLGITKLMHKKKMISIVTGIQSSTSESKPRTIVKPLDKEICSLNNDSCWEMLQYVKETVPEMENLIWKYMTNKAEQIVQSVNFNTISEENLIKFLQLDLQIDEFSLLLAVTNWIENNPKCSSTDIAQHIRFGLLTQDQLVKAENILWIRPDMLYFAWRKLAAPKISMKDIDVPTCYFMPREHNDIISARYYRYKPTISSIYSGFSTPTYECLTNEEYNLPGAATNYESETWLMATYEIPVTASTLVIGAPNGGLYTHQGWNYPSYSNGLQLQVSSDCSDWRTILTTANSNATGPTEYTFTPETSKYWRLYKVSCYLATGTFILK